MELDEVDFRILKELQEDGRAPLKNLAKAADVSIPTARSRIQRLVQMGVIRKFTTALDAHKLVGGVTAFITLKAKLSDLKTLADAVSSMVEVSEAYITTGQHDVILKVYMPDMAAMQEFILHKLPQIGGVEGSSSSFVVETVKEQFGPTLRPGFGVKLFCNYDGNQIAGEMIKKNFEGREYYFCCPTCASSFERDRASRMS